MRVETIVQGLEGGRWRVCGDALLKLRREAFEEVVHRLTAIGPTPHVSFGVNCSFKCAMTSVSELFFFWITADKKRQFQPPVD